MQGCRPVRKGWPRGLRPAQSGIILISGYRDNRKMITPEVFASLSALADPLRCRLLLLLERKELSVAELVRAMQLPQSSISRHLKALGDEGLVSAREEGASNRYSMKLERLPQPVRRLWGVLREQTAELPAAEEDTRRLATVLSERRTRSQA